MEVTLLMAMTVDGKIARHPDHFPDWTTPEDKKFFAERTRKAGAVIMGSRTFRTLKRPLPGRLNVVMTRNRSRASSEGNVLWTSETPREILSRLASLGYTDVILAGGAQVNSAFAAEGLIDRIVVAVSPKIFGTGISLFASEVAWDLELEDVQRIGQLVVLSYMVAHSKNTPETDDRKS